ncbi:MAG: alpha/beta fold hydrolase [Actinomycetota bacterium]|nr:alpha/beta fold hydrolase [Actinomycetota bacterium]MDQ2848073.1 alpha/beta fold hydrolase [Actinomycetota bacterium]
MNLGTFRHRRRLAILTVFALASAVVLPLRESTPAIAASCSSASTPATNDQSLSRRPVIFVHGWTSNGSALTGAAKELRTRTGDSFTPYFFDYAAHSTTWAATDVVEGCLAQYIQQVSAAYYNVHGDGKVLLVAHSMGGLATLYASAAPNVSADIGGLITFDTPYLGSPFGGTGTAAVFQRSMEVLHSIQLPAAGSDAQQCLVPHQNGADLAAPCEATLPPYLSNSIPLTEIDGQVTVRRTFAGIHLYDINLDSDGIVPTESSHGYIEIQKKAQWPKGEPIEMPTATCVINSDNLTTAAEAAKWSTSSLVGLAAGAGQIAADNNALDGLLSGNMTWGLKLYLGAATLAAPCSHIHIYSQATALDAAANSITEYNARLAAHDALTYQNLLSTPVPPLCQFHAGTLTNGTLVGHHESQGEPPTLAKPDKVAFGDLDGNGVGGAAGVVQCNAGGVSWPDNIVFWVRGSNGQPKVLGSYFMGDAVGDARGSTQKVTYLPDGSVQVDTLDSRMFDFACCPSGHATVVLKWNGHKVIATHIDHLPGPNDITFAGIGPIKLGMSAAQLDSMGYAASAGSDGCVNYAAPDGQLYVVFDPKSGRVVKISPNPDSNQFRTADGLGTGALMSEVRKVYAGKTIEDHEDRSFGQGSSGLLVGDGSGGWISFLDEGDGFIIGGIAVSDHQHYGALEAGC